MQDGTAGRSLAGLDLRRGIAAARLAALGLYRFDDRGSAWPRARASTTTPAAPGYAEQALRRLAIGWVSAEGRRRADTLTNMQTFVREHKGFIFLLAVVAVLVLLPLLAFPFLGGLGGSITTELQ